MTSHPSPRAVPDLRPGSPRGRHGAERARVQRILFAHPGTELYGSDRMAVETVSALCDAGYRVTVLVPGEGPLVDRFHAAGADVQQVPVPVLRKEYLSPRRIWGLAARTLVALRLAYRYLRASGASLLYVNTITQPVWMLAARLARLRFICHVREAENGVPRAVRSGLLWPVARADLVISNSRFTERFVVTSSLRRPRRHRVIYNGKNWDQYFMAPPKRLSRTPHLVVIGRLSPRKGQRTVVEALALLACRGVHATATFVGDAFPGYEWYAEGLRDRAAELSITDRCRFVGFSQEVEEQLAAADIAVVPSLIEPFGTVAAEAMAAMRPTIASRTEGLAEIIEHGHTGLLVEPGDASDLAAAIHRLVEDPAFAKSLAESGYGAIRDRFSAVRYRTAVVRAAAELLEEAR